MSNTTIAVNDCVYINEDMICVDLPTGTKNETRYIASLSTTDITDVALSKSLRKAKFELTRDMVGKTLAIFRKNETDDAKMVFAKMISFDEKRVEETIKALPEAHKEAVRKSRKLVNNGTYIKNFLHLEELLDLPHVTTGGDFTTDDENSVGGDVKFYKKNSSICLGGAVKVETVLEQGRGLVILWHPSDDKHHSVGVSYLNIWEKLPGSENEMRELIERYENWKSDPNHDANAPFETENFRIALHTENEDRFYINADSVRRGSTQITTKNTYVKKKRDEHLLEQFNFTDSTIPTNNARKAEKDTITLREIMALIEKNKLTLPDYQRQTIINTTLIDDYVGDTIMNDLQLTRGEFMFHHDGQKIYLVDGQQRIFNAIYNYFIKNGGTTPFTNDYKRAILHGRDVSDFTWADFNRLAETHTEIKTFRDEILNRKFSVKNYYGYTQQEMADEYVIANKNTTMNRQELRAAYESYLGRYVRYFTAPLWKDIRSETFVSLRSTSLVNMKIFDEFFTKDRMVLRRVGISTDRMNIDKLMSQFFNWLVNWGKPTFKENDDAIDVLYNNYKKEDVVAKLWPKFTECFSLIIDAMDMFEKKTPQGFPNSYKKGDRRLRNKMPHIVISNKEEWDLIVSLIMELRLRHTGKTLKITDDVIGKILTKHYNKVVFHPEKSSTKPNKDETPYGLSVRVNARTYNEVTKVWFPEWTDLLEMKLEELKSFGFTFE